MASHFPCNWDLPALYQGKVMYHVQTRYDFTETDTNTVMRQGFTPKLIHAECSWISSTCEDEIVRYCCVNNSEILLCQQ